MLLPASMRAQAKERPEPGPKKHRVPKAPNPLSMKKKQKVRQEPPAPRKKGRIGHAGTGAKRGLDEEDTREGSAKRLKRE